MTTRRQIVVGRITGAFGIHGEVRVKPFTEVEETLLEYPVWQIGRDAPDREVVLEKGRRHGEGLAVRFRGMDERNGAEALAGFQVWLYRDQLPETDEDTYYWNDLIGCHVVTEQEEELGRVLSIMATGANDVLVIGGRDQGELLLPFIRDVVLTVDLTLRRLVVRPMAEAEDGPGVLPGSATP